MPWEAWSELLNHCFPQSEIQDAAYQYQRAVERKEKLIVGVNEFLH